MTRNIVPCSFHNNVRLLVETVKNKKTTKNLSLMQTLVKIQLTMMNKFRSASICSYLCVFDDRPQSTPINQSTSRLLEIFNGEYAYHSSHNILII